MAVAATTVAAMFAERPESMPNGIMEKEYVSSLTFGFDKPVRRGRRMLPKTIDDLQRGVRFDIYETMMLDAQVKSCVGLFIAGILGGGLDVLPASKATDDGYEADSEVARFCQDALLKHLETPFLSQYLPDMLKAFVLGHRISEKITYPIEESPVPGKMIFKRLKVKPRKRVCFVVDKFMNVTGIAMNPQPYVGVTPQEVRVFPRDKFAVFSWNVTDSDPRGQSDLRCVYEPYWNKQKIRPMRLQYLHQFASPSLIGKTAQAVSQRQAVDPDTGQPKVDPATGKPIYVNHTDDMKIALEQFQNSSIVVVPFGAEVNIVEVKGDGKAFILALAEENLEIAKGILYATLATEQSEGQGRAASAIHAETMAVRFDEGIEAVERFVEQEFLAPLVAWNYPPGTQVPRARLPGANKAEFLAWASAVAKLEASGYLDPSQYDGTDAKIGLTKRSAKALKETIEAKTKERELAALPPVVPGVGGTNGTSPKGNEKKKITTNLSEEETLSFVE
jgi:hypothetical protein